MQSWVGGSDPVRHPPPVQAKSCGPEPPVCALGRRALLPTLELTACHHSRPDSQWGQQFAWWTQHGTCRKSATNASGVVCTAFSESS